MVAVTYGVARVPTAEPAAKAGRARPPCRTRLGSPASWMRWSRRAWSRPAAKSGCTRGCCPTRLDERGNRLVKTGSDDMPFGGW